jgi:hypothetical protein
MKSLTLTILFIVFFFINTEAQQMKDPLYGNHTLGNSAELVTLRPQIGGENCYLKLYDYTGAKNITGMTVEEQSGTWALGGHKQMDVVCGDFNSDGYDDIVAAWEGADKSIILMIPRINQGICHGRTHIK